MQTFLPYASFDESAKALDNRRLGKQRVEVLQLLRALSGLTKGWTNHPAARMWRDARGALVEYGIAICDEWIRRGFKDTCREKIAAYRPSGEAVRPAWLGNPDFHSAHRSNLLRKDPVHYGRFGWSEPPTKPYIWPVGA